MSAEVLAVILAAHVLGDWVIQTDRMAANKTVSWRANQEHVFTYHLPFLLLLPVWTGTMLGLYIFLGLSWVTHSIIDRRWPVKKLMAATGSERFSATMWGVLVVDQSLHISILLYSAVILA